MTPNELATFYRLLPKYLHWVAGNRSSLPSKREQERTDEETQRSPQRSAWTVSELRRLFMASCPDLTPQEEYPDGVLGIPPGVDIRRWYDVLRKREPIRQDHQATGEEKRDYYHDLVYDLYRASGYSIEESVDKAYSPQGTELIRYLSDDKRHPLNRSRVGEPERAQQEDEDEQSSAV